MIQTFKPAPNCCDRGRPLYPGCSNRDACQPHSRSVMTGAAVFAKATGARSKD
jgi:hypothetical protein